MLFGTLNLYPSEHKLNFSKEQSASRLSICSGQLNVALIDVDKDTNV